MTLTRLKQISGILLLSLLVLTAGASELQIETGESNIEMLGIGLISPDWPKAASGEHWWGLFRMDDGSFSVLETTITISEEYDACMAQNLPHIAIDQDKECLFLVRGSIRFKEGPVEIAYADGFCYVHMTSGLEPVEKERRSGQCMPGEYLPINQFKGYHETLFALGNVVEPFRIENYSLNITGQSLRSVFRDQKDGFQNLLTVEETSTEESLPAIVWIGDLDHDGRLDILIDAQPYPGSKLMLFLSSEAEEGEIVGKVAELQTPGC